MNKYERDCENTLQVCINKHLRSLDREAKHAAAAATLDEAIVFSTDRMEQLIQKKKSQTAFGLITQIRRMYDILMRAHMAAAEFQSENIDSVAIVRLGPGGDYIVDIMEDDV